MYPFASLPANLAAFCRVLNRDYDYRVGPRELQDAARALEVVPIGSERAVRDTLCPVLASSHDNVLVFDDAFDRFFHRHAGHGPVAESTENVSLSARARRTRRPGAGRDDAFESEISTDPGAGDAIDVEPDDEKGHSQTNGRLRTQYSPLDATGQSPELGPIDPAWRTAGRAFVRRIEAGPARAWRPAKRGRRFDLGRTLRSSLRTGGELILTRWRLRPRRRPRLVVFIDGSRSMSAYVGPPLRLAIALASITPDVDVFVFSTALRRITPDVRLAARGQPRRLPVLEHAWGGGTSIGACLVDFMRRFGERLLSRRTVLIIASDALDTGAPRVLRAAMERLHRLTAGIIWLNPLIETPGYEPTAAGMQAARPHVTTLTWVEDAAGLRCLARETRLRN
jgi:uncharacterized protein with von Willebrand factor type A (vWA) domain